MIQYSVVLPISFLAVVELSYVCMYGAYSYPYFWESIKGVKLNRPNLSRYICTGSGVLSRIRNQ